MDDLKLYGKNRNESLMLAMKIFTQDVRIKFGLQKCATIAIKNGKNMENDEVA